APVHAPADLDRRRMGPAFAGMTCRSSGRRPPLSGASAMSKPSLRELEHHDAFVERHIGPNDAEVAHMLREVGHDSLESMTDAIVPATIKPTGTLDPASSP